MALAIIGGGVIGLTTGVLLLRKGHRVVIYAESLGPGIASSAACALWLPFLMGGTKDGVATESETNDAKDWADTSWSIFKRLVRENCGVRRVKHVEVFENRPPTPFYADLVEDFWEGPFGEGPRRYTYCWKLTTFVVEMQKYLPWLLREFKRLGGEVEISTVKQADISAMAERVIFNCTGLGARDLFSDRTLVPIKGQILLHNRNPLRVSLGAGRFCVIPRSDGVALGTLFIEKDESLAESPKGSDELYSELDEWGQSPFGVQHKLAYLVSREKQRSVLVGIRPFRQEGVRISVETTEDKIVIHNYGHGGSGITFSWGTAARCVDGFGQSVMSTLERLNPSRTAITCEVSIELAHVDTDKYCGAALPALKTFIGRTRDSARKIAHALNEYGVTYSQVVLVDDKRLNPRKRSTILPEFLAELCRLGVDYYCLESQLERCVGDLMPLLNEGHRHAMERRIRNHGRVACSHDIVIWYSLRLGIIQPPPDLIVPLSRAAKDGIRPFVGNRLISILSDHDMRFEAVADRVIADSFGLGVAASCHRLTAD